MHHFIPAVLTLSLAFQSGAASTSTPNTLTAAEKAAGWQLLFDGRSLEGWRGYRRETLPEAGWEVKDGTLRTVAKVKGSDLITRKTFNDFELTWDWRVAPGGNNGVKYFVTEERPQSPGHEYQMIDDSGYPGTLSSNHHTADFYDVLPAAADKPVRPAGEWNTSRIVVRGLRAEHWLNGKMVLTYELGSAAVKAGIEKSKFKGHPGFGDKIAGHIMVTYHQDECWYRNMKIREIK
jgi:3-keto-disaccharide hydrolase